MILEDEWVTDYGKVGWDRIGLQDPMLGTQYSTSVPIELHKSQSLQICSLEEHSQINLDSGHVQSVA